MTCNWLPASQLLPCKDVSTVAAEFSWLAAMSSENYDQVITREEITVEA
jgi:hypothetical protein